MARRRWLEVLGPRGAAAVAVAGIVLLVGLLSVVKHPDTYVSGATLVFAGSPSAKDLQNGGVPVDAAKQSALDRDDPTVAGDVFVQIYEGSAKQRELAEKGLVGTLDVTTVRGMSGFVPIHGPTMSVAVRSPTPDLARTGVALVVADVRAELRARQKGSDPRLSVDLMDVSPPSTVRISSGSHRRSAVGFAGLALLAGLITPPLLRALGELNRRRAPRAQPAQLDEQIDGHGAWVTDRSSTAAAASTSTGS